MEFKLNPDGSMQPQSGAAPEAAAPSTAPPEQPGIIVEPGSDAGLMRNPLEAQREI